jgi:hypothetical protein
MLVLVQVDRYCDPQAEGVREDDVEPVPGGDGVGPVFSSTPLSLLDWRKSLFGGWVPERL